MAKVTQENIITFNELYLKVGTYAQVARETGFSPSTIKKYIIPNYISKTNIDRKVFHKDDLPEFAGDIFNGIDNWGDLCSLSKEEEKEIIELWNELLI